MAPLLALPGVEDAVAAARDACTQLRWHPALRRRTAQARAEACVRAARCSAALEGARLPVSVVRDAVRGAQALPDGPVGTTVNGAVRALAEVERLAGTWERAPLQVLARLHTAANAGLLGNDVLGRPRTDGEQPQDGQDLLGPDGVAVAAPQGAALSARLSSLVGLLTLPATAPALVVAALAHAEVAVLRPFVAGNGVVARALCRAVVVGRSLDPTGTAVWEAALLDLGAAYPLALGRYATNGADGVAHWLRTFAQAVVDGAGEGRAVCDAVLAGRLPAGL